MEIIEFNQKYRKDVEYLLSELQIYICEIDKYKLNFTFDNYGEYCFENDYKELEENEGKMFIAVENEKAVGMICGYIGKYPESYKVDYTCPKKGVVSELIVTKAFRRDGVGQLLMEKMEEYFREKKCEFVNIDVFAYNLSAKKFYEKNGYEDRMFLVTKKLEY